MKMDYRHYNLMTDSCRRLSSWVWPDKPSVTRISVDRYDRAYVPQCFLHGVSVLLRGRSVLGVLTADENEDSITLRDGRVIAGKCALVFGRAF